MRQNSLQKNKVQTGQAENPGSGQAGSTCRTRDTDRTTGKGHGTRGNNPTADKGKTDTIYRGGNTVVRHQTNETRVAEGRCRELNN